MTQCFHPDAPSSTTWLPPGYKAVTIDGTMYLLNDTMNHLMVVPPAAPVAATPTATQDVTLLDLMDQFVTPSATKKRKSNKWHPIVLSEHEQGNTSNSSSIIYVRACKKKKEVKAKGKKVETNPGLLDLVSSPPSAPPSVVDVEMEDRVHDTAVHLRVLTVEEVKTQDLPQTEDFPNYTEQDESMSEEAQAAFENEIESEQSVDLLAEDSQK
jgi:hypothetical protein